MLRRRAGLTECSAEGFDQIMPEGRSSPWKFFPRPGARLSITFGRPVDNAAIRDALGLAVSHGDVPELPRGTRGGRGDPARPQQEAASARISESGWLGEAAAPRAGALAGEGETPPEWRTAVEVARIRSAVTALLQSKVEELGREVMGMGKGA